MISKAEAALSHIGFEGLREPSLRPPWGVLCCPQISPTRHKKDLRIAALPIARLTIVVSIVGAANDALANNNR